MLKDLFSLSDELCRLFEQQGTLRTYEKDTTLFVQNDDLDSAFFVLSGLTGSYAETAEGERFLLSIFGPGHFCGDVPMVGNGMRAGTLITLDKLTVLRVPRELTDSLAENSLEFCKFLNKTLNDKFQISRRYFDRLIFASSLQALAGNLLELREVTHSDSIKITQFQLAQLTRCSKPTLIQELQNLESIGTIKTHYGRVIIKNIHHLEEIVMAS